MMNGDFDWAEHIGEYPGENITLMGDEDGITYNPILTDEIFNDVKNKIINVWNTYDNQFGYVDEKIETINSLPQEWDSVILMFRMFHVLVRNEIIKTLNEETTTSLKLELSDRKWGDI